MNAYQVGETNGEIHMLVFAPNARRARVISYGTNWHDPLPGDWVHWEARRMRDVPEHLAALDTGKEQVIEAPECCQYCETWGGHKLQEGCSHCSDPQPATRPLPI